MAKQQKPNTPTKPQPRQPDAGGFSAAGYIFRNLAILAVILVILFVVYNRNARQDKMQELSQEFYYLRDSRSNPQRLQEVYDEIMAIQNDSSFFTRVTRGYRWAIHDMALGNYENIQSVDSMFKANRVDSTAQSLYEQKMRMRVGNYGLFEYINKNTPKDAVILLPPADTLITKQSKWNFVYEPEWVEFFIYPRLCISPRDEAKYPDLAKRISHVLIVEGIGYDKLKYEVPVEQRVREGIFPINQPPAALNSTP